MLGTWGLLNTEVFPTSSAGYTHVHALEMHVHAVVRLGVVTHTLHSPGMVCGLCAMCARERAATVKHTSLGVCNAACSPVHVGYAQRPVVRLSTRIAGPASDQSLMLRTARL